jgi:hypothetical protein
MRKAIIAAVDGEAAVVQATPPGRLIVRSRLVRWTSFRSFVWMFVILQAILFLCFIPQTRILRPYSDMIDLINFYFQFAENGDWLAYLLEPHNYHRLIWFRLLLAMDVAVFRGASIPFLVVALTCFSATVFLLAREVRRAAPEAVRLPATAFALMLLLSTANVVVVSVPANTPYVHTLLFAVMAILLSEPGAESRRSVVTARRLAALACMAAAAFSNAVGLVLWPVLAFMALRAGRRERAWLALLLVSGAVFGVLYLSGQPSETGGSALSTASLLKSADYFFAYLGTPWVRVFGVAGRLIGGALLLGGVIAILTRGGPDAPRSERVALGLILFSLGTAALAAMGRRDIAEVVVVPGRYAILLTPIYLGLFILALPWIGRQWQARARRMQQVVVIGFAALIGQQMAVGQVVTRRADAVRSTITQFHQGDRDPAVALIMHPDLNHAEAVCVEMRRRGVYHHHWFPGSRQKAPPEA